MKHLGDSSGILNLSRDATESDGFAEAERGDGLVDFVNRFPLLSQTLEVMGRDFTSGGDIGCLPSTGIEYLAFGGEPFDTII